MVVIRNFLKYLFFKQLRTYSNLKNSKKLAWKQAGFLYTTLEYITNKNDQYSTGTTLYCVLSIHPLFKLSKIFADTP